MQKIPQLYVEKRLSSSLSYQLLVTSLHEKLHLSKANNLSSVFMMKKNLRNSQHSRT